MSAGDAPTGRAGRFLALHVKGRPLLQPNAWDAGSARILASLGFEAMATTSSGFAASLGRPDGGASAEEVLAHCAAICQAVEIPVAADLENGYAREPTLVADTVRRAAETGLAGCSIEDYSKHEGLYDPVLAAERVAAAAEAAHGGDRQLVLTARAENHIRANPDLADTIARLQTFQAAGADVLFAPGINSPADIKAVIDSVDLPVNILVEPGSPPVPDLASLGVARISVGGAFAFGAYARLVEAAEELRQSGTYGFWDAITANRAALRDAFR
ncbi:MAG TPA: isocitrate lyase/phosphoenolpyruvate mutase family protein [Acidimicrobiales bacterium]|nr:isocitrate lyase/phosphoenolpyruvate mutase family protein [Acidimicrobiales bacterium]